MHEKDCKFLINWSLLMHILRQLMRKTENALLFWYHYFGTCCCSAAVLPAWWGNERVLELPLAFQKFHEYCSRILNRLFTIGQSHYKTLLLRKMGFRDYHSIHWQWTHSHSQFGSFQVTINCLSLRLSLVCYTSYVKSFHISIQKYSAETINQLSRWR